MEFEKLKKIIAEVLNVDEEEVTMESTFTDDLGADSLDIFQIIMGIEDERRSSHPFYIKSPVPADGQDACLHAGQYVCQGRYHV